MLINALRRSTKLHRSLIDHKVTIRPAYQSYTLYEIRINLYSNRLSIANGFGLQSLSIAGTNTLLQHINSTHNSYNHLHKRYHYVSYGRYRKSTETHKPNWNKKHLHGLQYDTNKELNQVFGADFSVVDQTKPEKKRFDFEYLEFLKQKYRNNAPKQRSKTKIKLQNTAKRQFSSEAQPGAPLNSGRLTAQQQQIMAKEDEINPTSLGGIIVIAIGAAIFYWLYNIDNTKHSGISSFLSRFSKTKSIDDFINKQSTKPIHKIPDDWTAFKVIVDHIKNACLCWFDSSKYNSEWIWSKLFRLFYIPNAKLLPPTKQTVYTLVIDLDTVCHSTWSRKEGFERTMRPFYKEFISRMFLSGWEIVIFGQCEDYDWMESPDFVKLDGKGYIQNYLWNKDCYYFNGHRCKDLNRLGRDLRHVIAIDSDARSIQMQPQNGLVLNKWKPSNDSNAPNDTSLLQLIEFLEYLAKAEVADVKQVLAAYRGKDIAQEFRKRYFAAVQAQLQQVQPPYEPGDDEEEEHGQEEGEESYEEQEQEQEYAV